MNVKTGPFCMLLPAERAALLQRQAEHRIRTSAGAPGASSLSPLPTCKEAKLANSGNDAKKEDLLRISQLEEQNAALQASVARLEGALAQSTSTLQAMQASMNRMERTLVQSSSSLQALMEKTAILEEKAGKQGERLTFTLLEAASMQEKVCKLEEQNAALQASLRCFESTLAQLQSAAAASPAPQPADMSGLQASLQRIEGALAQSSSSSQHSADLVAARLQDIAKAVRGTSLFTMFDRDGSPPQDPQPPAATAGK
eukprot:tig00021037_g17467.t1